MSVTPTPASDTPVMSPEIVQARDALAASERTAGNHEWADAFATRTFDNLESVHRAYGSRDDEPAPDATVDPDEPAKLAGKFETPEALEKAYLELQAKLGAPKAPDATTDKPLEIKAAEVAEGSGLSMDDLQTHYNENGSLSDDHYAALAKSGLAKEAVDSFIGEIAEARTQKAVAAQSQIFESVGGEEAYGSMIEWASGNLDAAEISSFNKATNSGDLGLINLAVQGLQAKHKAAVGSGGTQGFVSGAATATKGTSGFESQQEMIQAMNDPRFSSLPSYQAEVRARMAKTTAF